MVDFYNYCRIIFAKIDIFSRKSRISRISRPRLVTNITNITNIAAANSREYHEYRDIREYHRYSRRYSRPRIPHFRGDFANSAIFATPLVKTMERMVANKFQYLEEWGAVIMKY